MSIHIVQGRVTVGANLIAARIKGTKGYDYRLEWIPADNGGVYGCSVTIIRDAQEVGVSTFDYDDAKRAKLVGKDNYQSYPRNMYFSRAISNAVRWYCPEVFNGATVYTPDEMGAVVDEEGNILEAPTSPYKALGDSEVYVVEKASNVPQSPPYASKSQIKRFHDLGKAHYGNDWATEGTELLVSVSEGRTDNTAHIYESELQSAIDCLVNLLEQEPTPEM